MRRGCGEAARSRSFERREIRMLSRGLGTAALLLLLAGPVGPGYAQAPQPAVPPDAGQQDRTDKAVHSPSGKSGTEEPSSHAPTAPPQDSAPFVNGRLA